MKKKLGKIVGVACYLIVCFFIGFFGAFLFQDVVLETDHVLLFVIVTFICIYLSMFMHIIIHECGHLIFGLMTGYKFLSLRFLNVMLIKENGKFKIKKYSLAGTQGQCILTPPDTYSENIPYLLYHLGGCINNLIFSTIAFILIFSLNLNIYIDSFLAVFFIIGITLAVLNGVPLKLGILTNDGSNAYELHQYPQSRYAIYQQMKISELQMLGQRLKDMPESLFEMPSKEDWKLPMCFGICVMNEERLLDSGHLDAAFELSKELMNSVERIPDIYRNILINNQICYYLLNNQKEEANKLLDKKFKKFQKAMRTNPSFIRTKYACHLLLENNEKEANKDLLFLEKITKDYPIPSEIEGEKELIQMTQAAQISTK